MKVFVSTAGWEKWKRRFEDPHYYRLPRPDDICLEVTEVEWDNTPLTKAEVACLYEEEFLDGRRTRNAKTG